VKEDLIELFRRKDTTMSSIGLSFNNEYSETVYVAIIWLNRQANEWEKKGWWTIKPGGTVLALGFDLSTDNEFAYYYAETAHGVKWEGAYYSEVPKSSFDLPQNATGRGWRTVGFQEIDLGNYSGYTVSLTPP
jgi:uncharacterized membrane protein